ncbi:MAG: TMEM175 family protein [Bacteroidia bacterium]
MNKTRLEAFSDGVLAIIITIMVLEIKIPHSAEWVDLKALIPVFISYLLSFLFVGIYWGNHHHLLHSLKSISSGIIWGNLNLLFWLSLIPFSTGWMGENHFAPNTVMVYGVILLLSGVSFNLLQKMVEKHTHDLDALKKAFVNLKKKGIVSAIGYASAIPLAYVNPVISGILFFAVAILWIIPDKNIEKALSQEK